MNKILSEFRIIRRLDGKSIDLSSDDMARIMVGVLSRASEGDLPEYKVQDLIHLHHRLKRFYLPTMEVSLKERFSNFWPWFIAPNASWLSLLIVGGISLLGALILLRLIFG